MPTHTEPAPTMPSPAGPPSTTPPHSIQGKVIVVTGAGRGIGRGIARHLGKQGATLAIFERRDDLLADAVGELENLGVDNLGILCDVSDKDAVFESVSQVIKTFRRLDGLVNNAQKFVPVKNLEDVTAADVAVLHETGTCATLWGMQAVFEQMKSQKWGRIVNVASSNAISGATGYAPYNASKEAIRALTRTAAREWAKYGIVVNCYCPASVAHRLPAGDATGDATGDVLPSAETKHLEIQKHRQAAFESMYANHPMGRDGDAETDIGPVVAFLCSDACRYMTGETLMVDGGGHMRA